MNVQIEAKLVFSIVRGGKTTETKRHWTELVYLQMTSVFCLAITFLYLTCRVVKVLVE